MIPRSLGNPEPGFFVKRVLVKRIAVANIVATFDPLQKYDSGFGISFSKQDSRTFRVEKLFVCCVEGVCLQSISKSLQLHTNVATTLKCAW